MIDWLIGQVHSLWSRVNSAFSYAYNVASSLARAAEYAARAWAAGAIASAQATLNSAINGARALATDLYQAARSYASALFDQAGAVAGGLVAAARGYAEYLYQQALGWITDRVEWLKAQLAASTAWLQSWVNGLIGDLIKWFFQNKDSLVGILAWFASGVLDLWNWLKKLTEILTPANLRALADFFSRIYNWLVEFLKDPIGYIAAFVLSFFLDMLCDVVAQGMGTVKYDLPPPRTYGAGGFGGAFPTGPGPGPGASGISAPVSPLYISGYHFGPGHPGIDLGIAGGQTIYAAHAGQVLADGWSDVGYGFMVVLEGGGWWSRYGHLKQPYVRVGDRVSQSQPIGAGDTTGNSTGNHLHFELKWQGKFVDPVTVLAGL